MALSSREILLVLRARDEATRTINRVSQSMAMMDRNAATTSSRMIDQQRQNLRQLGVQLADVNAQYSRTIADSWAMHRQQQNATNEALANLRGQVRAVNDQYVLLQRKQRDLRDAGRIDAATYRQNMKDIDRLRQDQLRSLAEERVALQDVARANHAVYNQRVADARNIHLQQKEAIRLEKQRAQAIIDNARDIEHAHRVEQENRRAAGHAIMANSSAIIATGAAMTYFGARATAAYATTVQSAIDYEQQARRTLTQVDNQSASLERVSEMGKRIANTVPVAFEQIQPAMYDVFSSIDVGMRGAAKLTRQFSKDAVGGTTELATATRANLAIMNAYKLGVEDVTDVSDFMFQLVRKGVGSYEEFAKTIGRAIPSARRAGQSYETLGAMLAFMTRNGLSAAMASTSAARALDAISHPKTVERLEKIGIHVKNMRGEFRPLPKILDEMNDKFGKMTAPERAKALQELFKSSGGTIQARRFFDQYFKNADEFNQRTREMANSAGAAEEAFNTMAQSPQAKLQQLKNDWMLLRIELGEHLMPIAMRIVETVNGWIDAFKNLSPETQRFIAIATGVGLVLVTVTGALTVGVGVIGLYVGAIKAMGGAVAATTGKLGLLGTGITASVGMMYAAKESTSTTAKAFSVLGAAAWGGVAGFAVGGPIGAAIGAGIGGLGGLWAATRKSSDGFKEAQGVVQTYGSTLDALTGQVTRATREMVLQKLQQDNILGIGQQLGLTTRTLIDASLGHEGAIKKVNEAYRGSKDVMERMMASKMQQWIKDNIGSLQAEKRQWELNNLALASRQDLIEKLPKEVRTVIKEVGAEPTKKQIRDVMKITDDLTRKEKRIVVELLGGRKVVQEAQGIGDALKKSVEVKPNWDPFLSDLATGGQASVRKAEDMRKKIKRVFYTSTEQKPNFDPFLGGLASGISTATSQASSGGNSIGNALKSGILVGFSGTASLLAAQAASAVSQAVAAARSAADAHSPSGEMMKVGKDLYDGLAVGWWKAAVNNSIYEVASKTVQQFVRNLLKDMATANPQMSVLMDKARELLEKKMDKQREALLKKIEQQKDAVRKANEATKGRKGDKLLSGIGDAAIERFDEQAPKKIRRKLEAIRNEIEKDWNKLQKVVDRYQKALKALDDAHTEFSNLESGLDFQLLPAPAGPSGPEWDALRTTVDRYKSTITQLEEAQSKLDQLQSERTSYISSLSSQLSQIKSLNDIQGAEIMESVLERGAIVQRGTGRHGPVTIGDIVSGMQAKLNRIREFGNLIGTLRGMGYTKEVIDSILQMGPEQGYQYAKALADATPDQIATINAADAGITSTANELATAAGSAMYDVGIAMQQAIVDGLTAEAAALRAAAQAQAIAIEEGLQDRVDQLYNKAHDLGAKVVNAFNDVLGIGEDSKGRKSGEDFAKGVRDGLDAKREMVANGARWLARAIVESFNEELRIHSPSKVGLGIGRNFGGSVGMGLVREKRNVEEASRALAYAMKFDPEATHVRSVPYSHTASGGNTFNQDISITTQELEPQRHAAMLGWELANRGL